VTKHSYIAVDDGLVLTFVAPQAMGGKCTIIRMSVDGWKIKVTTLDGAGRPALFRHYLACEADKSRAIALVRLHMSVNDGEVVEALTPVTLSELRWQRMKRGDVRPI
jgi:hypothetical protein